MPNTVRLHRVIAAKPEMVYRAFLEPDAIALVHCRDAQPVLHLYRPCIGRQGGWQPQNVVPELHDW